MYRYLIILTVVSVLSLEGWIVLINNFSVEVAGLEGQHIGFIQSAREIPGFLTFLAIFLIIFFKENHIAALSVMLLGAGVALTGWFPTFPGILITCLVASFGFHFYDTVNQSLALQYFRKESTPLVFGKLMSITAATMIIVSVAIFFRTMILSYLQIFMILGGMTFIVGVWAFFQNPVDRVLVPQKKKIVIKRKYWLFYLLTLIAGARRQIFMTFAIFLLVKNFHFTIQEITVLMLINSLISFLLSPHIGKAINRFGEKKILSFEYVGLAIIFLLYAVIQTKFLLALLYILDHMFFIFAMAIKTYFQKIAQPEDIAPSMAIGFTINHIAAVLLPALGGLLWMYDYRIPFIAGAGLAVISLIASQWMPTSFPTTNEIE